MSVILFANAQVRMEVSKDVFAQAADLVVRVGWLEGKRRILGVWETAPELEAGKVVFREVYRVGDREFTLINRRRV